MQKIIFIIEVEDVLVSYFTKDYMISPDPSVKNQADLMMSSFKNRVEGDNPGCIVNIFYKLSDRYNPKSNYYYLDAVTTIRTKYKI